jgi:hypothetical protein
VMAWLTGISVYVVLALSSIKIQHSSFFITDSASVALSLL